MSNTKHLADLLKVCSILPALAIMPAMAETEIIEGRLKLTDDKVYQTDVLANGVVGTQGGAFFVSGDVSLMFMKDATFQNNVAQGVNVHGGAIYNDGNVVFADEAKFVGNKSYTSGGAIRNTATGEMTFDGDAEFDSNLILFSDEYSKGGTGAAIANAGKMTFNGDVSFKNNSTLDRADASSQGGAIYNGGEMEFNGMATFTGNAAFNKGGVIENVSTGKMTFNKGIVVDGNGTSLDGNIANGINNGGILTITGGDAVFTNNTSGGIAGISTGNVLTIDAGQSGKILFENNTARDSIVGLYSSGSQTMLTADIISFKNNVQTDTGAKVYGGAVYNGGSGTDQGVLSLLAKNIVFDGNQVNGFQDGHKKIGGGALYNRGGGDKASLTDTVVGLADGSSEILFKNNLSAQHGGAIFSRTDDGAGFDSKITLNGDVEFSSNSAGENGGAIMNWTDGTGGLTDIIINGEVDFVFNKSGKNGGAIYNTGTVDLSKATAEFEGNIAQEGGGAIYNAGNLKFANSVFEDNKASVYGGAIYNTSAGVIDSINAEFDENKVISAGFAGGGAIANIGKISGLTGSFEENLVHATETDGDVSAKGGAIYTHAGSTMGDVDADFMGNMAISDGEAIGGAIVNDGNITKLNQMTSGFVDNSVVAQTNAWAGALYNSQGAQIDELVANFAGNSVKGGDWAAGGAVINYGKIGSMTGDFVNNLVIANNEGAGAMGGALMNFATIDALSGNFIGNEAVSKTSEYATGGAISNYSGSITMVGNNLFHNNTADYGGAIENYDTMNLTGTNTFTGNQARYAGAAIYNDAGGTINMSGDNTFSGNVAKGLSNDIHNMGTLNITGGETIFGGGVSGTGTFTLATGATLDIGTAAIKQGSINLDGTVYASLLNDSARGGSYGRFIGGVQIGDNAMFELNVGATGTYNIWDGTIVDESKVIVGDIYEIAGIDKDGVKIVTKSVADIAEQVGITTQAAGAVAGLANATSGKAHQVSLALQDALNNGDVAFVEQETAKLNPTDKPVAQAATTSVQNQVLSLTSGRMAGGISVGRAGGDEMSQENGFWIQGLFNKSKFGGEFHGYTRGVALGADTLIDRKWTVGGGLAFNSSDVHADSAHTDIDSKTLFLYGQYKPSKWYVNGTLTYNMSEYTENKNVAGVALSDMYDVDAYGAQIMTGYDFTPGITTEAGMRYLHIAQDAYTQESGAQIDALDTDFLSGVAGLKYAFDIRNDWAVQLRPELRAAMTYDFISDDASATVVMPGVASYKVAGERLSRMGGEFGIGLTAQYKGMEISLMYDLDLHRDYTSQTGMIKFRGKF